MTTTNIVITAGVVLLVLIAWVTAARSTSRNRPAAGRAAGIALAFVGLVFVWVFFSVTG